MTIFHSQIILGQKTIPYTIRVSSRARRFRIVISQSGIELVLPEGAPVSKANELMTAHADWLLHHLGRLEKARVKYRQEHLPAGIVLIEGKTYQVKISAAGKSRPTMHIDPGQKQIHLNIPTDSRVHPLRHLESLLQKQSRPRLKNIVRQRAAQMGFHLAQITIRDQRTRWGSCSSKGTISLNWRLIMAPPEVLDYVIVHELCHLKEHNHSKRFWQLVESHCPDFKSLRHWLKINACSLRPAL